MTWTDAGQGNVRRSVNAWDYIKKMAKSFAVFDVQTGLQLYTDMMFESGNAEQTCDSSGILRASLKLRRVTFATTASVLYPPRADGKPKRTAAPPKKDGREESLTILPPEDKPISIAVRQFNLPSAAR
jgi:hypothetical protein